MADTPFQTLLDNVALLLGGTPPDLTNRPGFYSGFEVNDATGVALLHGCYSLPPEAIDDLPIGLVLPGPFSIKRGNPEPNIDTIQVKVLVSRDDVPSEWPTLTTFRQTIPAAFRAHMTIATVAGATSLVPPVTEVSGISAKAPGPVHWGGTEYLGWDMAVTIRRDPFGVLYSA